MGGITKVKFLLFNSLRHVHRACHAKALTSSLSLFLNHIPQATALSNTYVNEGPQELLMQICLNKLPKD